MSHLLPFIALTAIPALVQAQTLPSTAENSTAEASSADVGEEVIVTARRRAERLQEVPVSITAFDAAALERSGSSSVADVALRSPGLQYGDFGDIKLSPTSLRGIIGSAASAGADPAIGYYVDEVFVGQGPGANLDLYDIARVEVIRGPQGVLFGRNTIGGVINITTKRPTEEFEASFSGEIGNYDYRRTGASISGALVPGLVSAKLAAIHQTRDGTSRNLTLDVDTNTEESWSLRGQLLFTLSPDTELLLTADHRKVDQKPLAFETLRYSPSAVLPALIDAAGLPRNEDPFDRRVYSDVENEENLSAWSAAATLRTRIGDVTLVDIASYRSHDYRSRSDTDRSALRMIYDGDPEDVWRFSNELRAEFTTGAVDWTTGLYYFRQRTDNQSFVEIGTDFATLLGSASLAGLRSGSNAKLDTTSYAAFANAQIRLSERFDISLGGRYTIDEKRIDFTQSDPLNLLGGDAAIKAKDKWKQFTPAVNARYRISPDVLVYAAISKGFKSGGFNDALGDADGIAFDPEKLWNYELGFKSSLLDRRLVINAAAYHMEWSDIQLSQDDPRTTVFDPIILNAGAAHSTGLELEVTGRVTPQLTLGFAGSAQEAEYDEGSLPDGSPLSRIPFAPSFTANLNAEYRVPVGRGDLRFFGEYLVRGTTYLNDEKSEDTRQSTFGLVNLRAGYEPTNANWRLGVWVKNLTDKTYKTRVFDLSGQIFVGQTFVQLGDPRTYGIDFRVDF